MTEGGIQEAPVATPPNTMTTGATDIHEIFHHARKLIADDEHRFVLDEVAFAEALEEPPLFLRRYRTLR